MFLKDLIGAMKYWMSKSKYVKPGKVKQVVIKPRKPRIHVDVDMNNTIAYRGCVVHHTGDNDDQLVRDFSRILYYQTSFRIDYGIIAGPVSGKLDPEVKYITYGKGLFKRYYKKYKVDIFNERKKEGRGRKFQKPWTTVAYQLIGEYVNNEIILNYGRPFYMSGAHSGLYINGKPEPYFNQNYIGICQIGDYNRIKVQKDVWNFILGVTRDLMDKFGFGTKNVIGHREVYDYFGVKRAKQCPGSKWDLNLFRSQL